MVRRAGRTKPTSHHHHHHKSTDCFLLAGSGGEPADHRLINTLNASPISHFISPFSTVIFFSSIPRSPFTGDEIIIIHEPYKARVVSCTYRWLDFFYGVGVGGDGPQGRRLLKKCDVTQWFGWPCERRFVERLWRDGQTNTRGEGGRGEGMRRGEGG